MTLTLKEWLNPHMLLFLLIIWLFRVPSLFTCKFWQFCLNVSHFLKNGTRVFVSHVFEKKVARFFASCYFKSLDFLVAFLKIKNVNWRSNCWSKDASLIPPVLQAYAQFAGAPLKLRKICNPWRSPGGESDRCSSASLRWKKSSKTSHALLLPMVSPGSLPALRTNQNETLSRPSDIIIHLRKQVNV